MWRRARTGSDSVATGLAVWDRELEPAERDRVVARIAERVVQRRLETPAILFLEMNKPLSFFASQSLIVGSPFLAPLVGFDNCRVAARLFESRDNVERLICKIEELAALRAAKGQDAAPESGGTEGRS